MKYYFQQYHEKYEESDFKVFSDKRPRIIPLLAFNKRVTCPHMSHAIHIWYMGKMGDGHSGLHRSFCLTTSFVVKMQNARKSQMLLIRKYLNSKVSLSVSCSLSIVIFSVWGVIGNIMHHVMTLGALFSAAGNINCNQDDNNISAFIILSALQCCFVLFSVASRDYCGR